MRAIVWEGPERARLARVPEPVIEHPTDAIVRAECASTCGTDLHILAGAIPGFEAGTILGHELVGRVVAVGTAVTRVTPGQRVRACDFVACGDCVPCRAGHHAQCAQRRLFGFSGIQRRLDGALAELVRVPFADVVLDPLPEDTDARAGLLAADVLPTALGALEAGLAAADDRVAVVGAGPVGLLTAWLATRRGAPTVLFEVSPPRAARAEAAGLTVCLHDPDRPLAQALPDQRGRFDLAVDAVGGERGLTAAIALAAPAGRVVGVGSQGRGFSVDWGRAFQRELALRFVIGNAIGMRAHLAPAMEQCRPLLGTLFSDTIGLADVPGYYGALARRERFKAVVQIPGGTSDG